MKNYKFIFSSLLVLVVVGSALKLSARANRDLRLCNSVDFRCILQSATTNYSSVNNGMPIVPTVHVFTGTVGAICGSAQCPLYEGTVYNNI